MRRTHSLLRRAAWPCALLALLLAPEPVPAQDAAIPSLDELLSVRVDAASRLEQTARRAPASVTVLTADEIERYGWRTLAEVLATVRGFHVTYDRNYSYVGVRGLSRPGDYSNRILLLVNGFRVNEDVYGTAPAGSEYPLDLRAVERIEVVRGPGSAAFGASAMLAVVNVILKGSAEEPRLAAALEAGSAGRLGAALRGGVEFGSGVGLAWSAVATEADGEDLYYPEYGGTARGLDWDRARSATLSASWRKVEFYALASSRDKGIPTGAWETDFGDPRSETRDAWSLAGLRFERELGTRLTLVGRGFAAHYAYDGDYVDGGVVYEDSTDNSAWGGELQLLWEPRANQRLAAGLEYRRNRRADYRSFDPETEYFSGDFPNQVLSLWAEDEFQLTEDLLVTAGVRRDHYSTVGSSTSPRLAFVYLPTRASSLKVLYGSAFRAPNVYEVYFEAPIYGAVGNPDLKPERVETIEAVWEQRLSPGLFGSVSLYRSRVHDLIDQQVVPPPPSDGVVLFTLIDGGVYQFRNAGTACAQGVEVEVQARRPSGLLAYASGAYQDATDEATGERLTNSPEWQVKLGASYPFARDWVLSANLLAESSRRTVQDTRTAQALVADAVLAWAPEHLPLRLELQVRNLFDETYSHPAGFEHVQDRIVQDGRSWALRAEWSLR